MRLMGSGRPPATSDVAAALTTAVGMLGQRPAITGHALGAPDGDAPGGAPASGQGGGQAGRREQGFASLAGWVAKGANLLHGELGLGEGDRIALAGPPGWPLAAVTLSAWWLGLTVVPATGREDDEGSDPAVLVTHLTALAGGGPARPDRSRSSVPHLVFGDALDGTADANTIATLLPGAEQWTDAVTPHGDRPPTPAHDGDLVALVTADGATHTQRTLLEQVRGGTDGVLGLLRAADEDLVRGPDAAQRLAALALRPLVTGAATVVVDAADPARDEHARSERIADWIG